MPIYDYKIALGHNMPDGSLVNVEAISVANTVLSLTDIIDKYELDNSTHYLVKGADVMENRVTVASGGSAQSGYTRKNWAFLAMSDVALQYWIDTYRGKKVTVRTTIRKYNSYEDWNATIGTEEIDNNNRHYLRGTWWYHDVKVPLFLQGTQP